MTLWFPACNSGALTVQKTICQWISPTFEQVNTTRLLILCLPAHTTWREHSHDWETQVKTVITSLVSIYLDNTNAISLKQNIMANLGSTEVSGNAAPGFNRATFYPSFTQSSWFIPVFHPLTESRGSWMKEYSPLFLFSVWHIYSRQAAVRTVRNRVTDVLSALFLS